MASFDECVRLQPAVKCSPGAFLLTTVDTVFTII